MKKNGRDVGVKLEDWRALPRKGGKGKGMPACASREANLTGTKAALTYG